MATAAGSALARVSVAGKGEAMAAAPPSRERAEIEREGAEIDLSASGPGATAQAGRVCSSRMSHPSLRRAARRSG